MTETKFGREPVQIVELIQPRCANVHGVAPCTATQTGDAKCFNTRATCNDPDNYRSSPDGHLVADLDLDQGDTMASGDLTRTANLFAAFDVEFTNTPSGVIWELGDATTAAYLGVTGGNIVLRAGDGASGTPANAAKVSVAVSSLQNLQVTLYAAIDVTANSVSLWSFDKITRVVTLLGTDTAAGSFSTWAAASDGAVGQVNGTTAVGEDSADFDGVINTAWFYDSTSAPDMTASFALSLFFSNGRVAERGVVGAPYIIPLLGSVSTSPTKINLAGSNPDASGLGNRALCTINFEDAPHTDKVVDPYLTDRTYNPFLRGQFWTKWMARNRYRTGMVINIYDGYDGQTLSQMRRRQYFMEKVDGPSTSGGFTMSGKDILARVEDRKAQAPKASPGELYADITDAQTSIEVAGAVLSDYPSSGTLRIGSEIMTYSSVATSTNGITFTISARGSDNSTAEAHSAEDAVQECLRYTDASVDSVLRDLLGRWAGVSYSFMDFEGWTAEVQDYLAAYELRALITSPVSVKQLVSEIQNQALCYVWWDEYSQLIKMRAIRGLGSEPDTITDERNILAMSFTMAEKPRERVSQVWVYINPEDPTASLSDESNWGNLFIAADLDSEGFDKYNEASVRKLFGRWLPTGALAENTASKIITRYVDVPRSCKFRLDAKDRASYGVGDSIIINHHRDVDARGQKANTIWTIVSAEEVATGHIMEYTAEDTTLYGRVYRIQAAGAADYVPGSTYFSEAFIGDADGLLSDGTPCARIS